MLDKGQREPITQTPIKDSHVHFSLAIDMNYASSWHKTAINKNDRDLSWFSNTYHLAFASLTIK